jgi:hypothetical protein
MTSVTLELTAEEIERLKKMATQTGADINSVLYSLSAQAPDVAARPMTGAEAIARWEKEGVLGLLSERADSPELARELR